MVHNVLHQLIDAKKINLRLPCAFQKKIFLFYIPQLLGPGVSKLQHVLLKFSDLRTR